MLELSQTSVLITESGSWLQRIQHNGQFYWAKHCTKKNGHIGDDAADNEWASYSILREAGIRQIPLAQKYSFHGKEWLLTSEAPGQCLLDITPPVGLEEAVFSLLQDLSSIHGTYFGSLTATGPHFDSEYLLMCYMFEQRCPILQKEYAVLRQLLDLLPEPGTYTNEPVFVAYDLWKGNLFWSDSNRKLTVIDLERCFFTDNCAEGASLMGLFPAEILENRLCCNEPKKIAKMYLYRALFLLERIDFCEDQIQAYLLRQELTNTLGKCLV